MKLNPVGANQTEVEIGGVTVFFSYKTPVAAHIAGKGYIRTEKHYSTTTIRHINQWLKANGASMDKVETVSQERIDAACTAVTL